MKKMRFSEEQIIAVLREQEAGAKTADLARKHGISEATLYNWKAKYGGMDVSEARRLRALEDELMPRSCKPQGAMTLRARIAPRHGPLLSPRQTAYQTVRL